MIVALRFATAILALLACAAPAAAQWTRVDEIPAALTFSVWANGDTIAAGADSVAYISTDAGFTWKRSAKVSPAVIQIEAVRVRNGRVYAGTLGQGVFVSDDLGDTWLGFNQGLVGGIANSQLYIVDLLIRGDSLYAATSGAGAWVRNLTAGTWSHFGNAFEPNQASNMNAIASGGSRLLASAGANGTVFHREAGQADWTLSWLDGGIVPGLAALTAIWTGRGWVVGSNVGVFISELGQAPWTFSDPGLGTLFSVSFALRGPDLFACFGNGLGSTIATSRDDGATWEVLDTLPATFTFGIATAGSTLYAARFDGLWRRSVTNVSVPPTDRVRMRFAIAGAHPVRDAVRFSFILPEPGRVVIDVFDLAGRRVSSPSDGSFSAGPHEVAWSAGELAPGVYQARLRAGQRTEAIRFVRVR